MKHRQLCRTVITRIRFTAMFAVFYLFSVCFVCLFAQPGLPPVNMATLTVEDGLSQSIVYSIAQDKKGFMWFATFNGLDRYDGNEFVHFRHNGSDTFSLSSNQVKVVFEDSKQRLWVGSNDNGLNYFDRRSRRFYHFFPGKRIIDIAEDVAGGIYVNLNESIVRMTIAPDSQGRNTGMGVVSSLSVFKLPETFFTYDHLNCFLFTDSHKNIFVSTRTGMFSLAFRAHTRQFDFARLYSYEALNQLGKLIEDKTTGKYYLINDKGILESSDYRFLHPVKIHNGIFFSGATFIDNKSRFWYRANETNFVLDLHTGRESVFGRSQTLDYDFGSLTPGLQDANGTLWLKTPGSGLATYSDHANQFHTLLPGHFINHMKWVNDDDFEVSDAWLVHLGKDSAAVTTIPKKDIRQYNYFDFPRDSNGICWHVENHTVVVGYNRSNQRVAASPIPYRDFAGIKTKLPPRGELLLRDTLFSAVYSGYLFLDRDDCLWLYASDGLIIFNTKNKKYRFIKGDIRFSFTDDTKKRMYEDAGGTVWVIIENGIFTYNKTTGATHYYLFKPADSGRSLQDKNITSFCDDPTDPQHIIWVSTRNGISRMDKRTGVCRNFTELDGLPNNVIYEMLPDSSGNLWMSTNKGLSCLNTRTFSVRNFTVKDGLQGSEFNNNSFLIKKDGTLIFGGTNGITYFNPKEIQPLLPPLTIVTGFKLFGKSINDDRNNDLFTEDIAYTNNVGFSYKDNVVSFTFAGVDYSKKNSLKYRYKLIGFDKDWNYSGTAREATYTNLDPGDYTFVAQASNTNGIWGKDSDALHVHILPLWWQTWWFKLLMAAALISIIYTFYRYRLRKALEVARVRNRIASDLHDEIGSTLSAIALFSEMAHQQSKTAVASPQLLQRINETSQKVTQTMRDIVWSVSTKNDSFENMVTHMHEHAVQLMEMKGYELSFTADEKITGINLSMEKRQNIYLIYKEALNNIIKYANGKKVWISIRKDKGKLLLSLKDDGVGFDAGKLNSGNGLQNMKYRAASIGGTIHIISSVNGGCEIHLSIPV